MTFEKGELVVCIDDRTNPKWGPSGLKRGQVYRVQSVRFGVYNILIDRVDCSVTLVGVLTNCPNGFSAFRFKKLPRATDDFTARIRACQPHDAPLVSA